MALRRCPSARLVGLWNRSPDRAADSSGEDWPAFLGPRQDNTSRETCLLNAWPGSGPTKIWSRSVGSAYSAPVTARGRLMAFHRVGDSEVIDCLDARARRCPNKVFLRDGDSDEQ